MGHAMGARSAMLQSNDLISPGKSLIGYPPINLRGPESDSEASNESYPIYLPHPSRPQVKSGDRALRVLEYFYTVRRPAKAYEIGDALGIPRSSAHELLHTLVDTGFLAVNSTTRTFFPSLRIVRMANFVAPFYFGETRVIDLLGALKEETGETAAVSVRNGLHMQMVAVEYGESTGPVFATEGSIVPILDSAAGCGYLMSQPKERIVDLLRKVSRRKSLTQSDPGCVRYLALIRRFQRQGFAVVRMVPELTSIAAALSNAPLSDALAIGIGGDTDRLMPNEIDLGRKLAEVIARFATKPA